MRKKHTHKEEEVNILLKKGVDIEAKWRAEHKAKLEETKLVVQYYKELSNEKKTQGKYSNSLRV